MSAINPSSIDMRRGERKTLSLTYQQSNGNAENLTGATLRILRQSSDALKSIVPSITDAAQGKCAIKIPATVTNNLSDGRTNWFVLELDYGPNLDNKVSPRIWINIKTD